jgi:subtilisin family serine protease
MKKYVFYWVVLVMAIIIIINLSYISTHSHKQPVENHGLYAWPFEKINAVGILPWKKKIPQVISIIDNGIDLNNPYYNEGNIKLIKVDDASDGAMHYHGTMVSGIIVSNGNGISRPGGVLPNSNLLFIQSGNEFGMTSNQMAKAILKAIEYNARVINISYSTKYTSNELEQAVNYALSKGAIIVASAGNDGASQNEYPAAYEGVIAVSALERTNQISAISNYSNNNLVVAADKILTTGAAASNHIAYFSGTSAAAPIITAICAIFKSEDDSWSGQNLKNFLISTSKEISYNGKVLYLVDVKNAFISAKIVHD